MIFTMPYCYNKNGLMTISIVSSREDAVKSQLHHSFGFHLIDESSTNVTATMSAKTDC